MKNHYRTIVLSDIHLGTKGAKAREVVRFLKQCKCEHLILNGDIIDGWQLKKYGKWKRKHTRFVNRVLKMMEEDNTKVTYLRGNHDDFLDQIVPLHVGNLSIQRDMVYEGLNGKNYFITHGDIFDSITSNMKWLAKLGDLGYTFLIWFNTRYNNYRRRRGLEYYSISQAVKAKVKGAVTYMDDYEQKLSELAGKKNCQGIICGHIHRPAIKQIGDIEYLNSGDWVESLSALVEDYEGDWNLAFYTETPKVKRSYHLELAEGFVAEHGGVAEEPDDDDMPDTLSPNEIMTRLQQRAG